LAELKRVYVSSLLTILKEEGMEVGPKAEFYFEVYFIHLHLSFANLEGVKRNWYFESTPRLPKPCFILSFDVVQLQRHI